MLDDFTARNRAIRAALELAAEQGWHNVNFAGIAARTGLSLADLRSEFTSKSDLLRAFQEEVDREVLARTRPQTADQNPRDRLFDIIMTRFEVMQPFKAGLRSVNRELCCHPNKAVPLICSTLASQYWMLTGAGAKTEGALAGLKVTGLASIYAQTFRVWLDDSSPGLDRTMAALDRKLRSGERCLEQMQEACRFLCGFLPRGWKRSEPAASAGAPTPPPGEASPQPNPA